MFCEFCPATGPATCSVCQSTRTARKRRGAVTVRHMLGHTVLTTVADGRRQHLIVKGECDTPEGAYWSATRRYPHDVRIVVGREVK